MSRGLALIGMIVAGIVCLSSPARADFSACASAYESKDLHQQIDLYTSCLKHGGLAGGDVAGAFNNRGIAYEQLGETDKALQDFIWATQYDPNWPAFRRNRAATEAQLGKCPEALADIDLALKLSPHNKALADEKARIVSGCPIISKPPN